jgi:cobalt/nickel transport system ATP-binding protein
VVVDLYNELIGRGMLQGSRPPRNVLELTDLLESETPGINSGKAPGKIYISNVDGADGAKIKNILEKSRVSYTGAMGTNAKVMAEHAGIPLDFTYGVIDKCILKALIGKNSLIMTSGGMVEHSLRRIQAYSEESGAKIEVIRLDPPEKSSAGAGSMRQEGATKPAEVA